MERIGERLRRRREELGLTLGDVSEQTRYRPDIIIAIEEGRTSVFPAKAYLSAFLRAYAVVLDLDPSEIVREQKSEEERAFEAIRNIRVKPKRRRKLPRRVIYIGVPIVLAAALLFVVDRFLWDRGPGTEETAPAPPVTAPAGSDTAASGVAPGDSTAGRPEGEAGNDSADPGTERDRGAGDGDAPAQTETEEALPQSISGDAPVREVSGEPMVPFAEESDETADAGAAEAADRRGESDPVVAAGGAEEDARDAADAFGDAADEAPVDEHRRASAEGAQSDAREGRAASADDEAAIPEEEVENTPLTPARPRRHKLVVSARRGAYVNLTSGGNEVYNGYFGGGEVDSFFSEANFVIVALTDRSAWTFVQDGERVPLPGSSSEDVSNFVIPFPADD